MPMIYFGIGLMFMGLGVFLLPKILNVPENPKHMSEVFPLYRLVWAVIEGVPLYLVWSIHYKGDQISLSSVYLVVVVTAMLKTFQRCRDCDRFRVSR